MVIIRLFWSLRREAHNRGREGRGTGTQKSILLLGSNCPVAQVTLAVRLQNGVEIVGQGNISGPARGSGRPVLGITLHRSPCIVCSWVFDTSGAFYCMCSTSKW